MMEVYNLIDTVIKEWSLLVAVFGLGAAWWQGKLWFQNVNRSMARVAQEHAKQDQILNDIRDKTQHIDARLTKIETTVDRMHEELHDQEIKLAVLESAATAPRRRKAQQ